MRHLTKVIISTAAVLLAAIGLAVPGAAPARAAGTIYCCYDILAGGGDTNPPASYWLHAHAINYQIDVESVPGTLQQWQFLNPSEQAVLDGAQVTAYELALANTDDCVFFNPSLNDFELGNSCTPGDAFEDFWVVGTGGSFEYCPQYWLISVEATRFYDTYEYMTTLSLDEARNQVAALPAGNGLNAVWCLT